VIPSSQLQVTQAPTTAGRVAVRLSYPAADPISDLTTRPMTVPGGAVAFLVNGHAVTGGQHAGDASGVFSVAAPVGATIAVAAGGASDHWHNTNASPLTLQ
jgi:hypothetical protein